MNSAQGPDHPEHPLAPDTPDTPAVPNPPVTPDAPALPNAPNSPNTPNSPGVPGGPHHHVEERLHPLTPLVRVWVGVVAIAWYFASSLLQGQNPLDWGPGLSAEDILTAVPWWVYLVLGGLAISLAIGYWSWWTTLFVIDDRELRIENKGAFKESRRIAFHRIQSVDVTQPFAARLLGLAELRIDVGADDHTTLAFLTRARATALRDYLMLRAHGRPPADASPGTPSSAWDDLAADDQILIRLQPGELLLGALLTTEMAVMTLFILVPLALSAALTGVWWLGLVGGIVPLVLAIGGFLGSRLFGQFNYTLARTRAGLRITRGLTTLKSQTIPVHRVQSIRLIQPPLWRLLGRTRIDLTVLGLGDAGGNGEVSTSTIFLPIGNAEQTRVALASVWPGLRLDALAFVPSSPRARWLDPFARHWQGHAVDADVIVVRRGWLTRRQLIVPHARLQSARWHQGPVERRLGLADVALHTTSALGDDRAVHLDAEEARALVFAELDRVHTARMDELCAAPASTNSGTEGVPF